MTDFRKAGADILRVLQSASDPPAETNKALLYAKDSGGTTKIFMRDSAGTVAQVGTGSGGGTPAWTAGSYTVGQTVTRGPYVWRANGTTSEDPFIVEGNLGLNTDWTFATGGTPGTTQTPGATDGAPNGKILLLNGSTSSQVSAFRQSVNTGVTGKLLVVDLQISGTADSFYWGMWDSSLVQTNASSWNATGFFGVEVDIYDPTTAEIAAISNGVRVGATQGYSNASSVNVGSAFSRWYAKFIQNGANWDVEVYRPQRIAATFPYSAFNVNQEDDLALIFRQTNVSRPSFSTWRFMVGGHTGGSAMICSVRAAYTRDIASGNWTAISRLPTLP
jgi:hypothetical protein